MKFKITGKTFLISILIVSVWPALAQEISVDINLDVKHTLGNVSTFDRNKFVAIHADVTENEWDGDNFTPDLRNDFLNGYDVYLGRNTGGIGWNMNNVVTEDPTRTGYASPASISSSGQSNKTNYGSKTNLHAYESRNDQILCAQLHPIWPDGQKTNKGWAFSQSDTPTEPFGTASGEYMGRFIHDAYGAGGTSGQAQPKYVEVINEPLYWLVDHGKDTPEKVFKFHNVVASQIRKFNPESNLQIGGYCTAFPDLDKSDFQEWTDRWKLFMDISGENMDFWTIHLYDFAALGGKQQYRKGSNMEATFDMLEQYSFLKFGRVKPFMVSEYGAVSHDLNGPWSALRDWDHIKSVNSMRMQFMERANIMNKTIDFLPVKAEWGTTDVDHTYSHRLLRKENEPASYTGKWVYAETVKIYQLWSDVKGTRVDAKSSNPDIMTDSYVNGNKVYVILNNLNFQSANIKLNLMGSTRNLQSVKIKHLYKEGVAPVLSETVLSAAPTSVTVGAEGTIILEYTYDNDIVINETSEEVKQYATAYFKPIKANSPEVFSINDLTVGSYGEAVLRLGIGRAHGKSLQPKVIFNGQQIEVPLNFRGDDQLQKISFFGVLEIPVPYKLVKASNAVSVEFPDGGGYVSSVAIRTYKFSKNITRTDRVEVTGVSLPKKTLTVGIGQKRFLTAAVVPQNATVKNITWSTLDAGIANVDANTGEVTGVSVGQTTVKATSLDGGFFDDCLVTVQQAQVVIPVENIALSSATLQIIIGSTYQLIATISPSDAANKTVVWNSGNTTVATVSATGLITAKSVGTATITVASNDGNKLASCQLTVKAIEPASIAFDSDSKYLNTTYKVGGTLDVICNFHAGSGNTVSSADGGIKYLLREIGPNWSVVKDYTAVDASVIGQESGTSSATISLANVKPSSELTSGNFYYLFVIFHSSNGTSVNRGISPVKITTTPLGLGEISKSKIKIYPNPATGILHLDIPKTNVYEHIEVVSLTGQVVLKAGISDSNFSGSIDLNSLQKGYYILRLAGKDIQTFSFIKE